MKITQSKRIRESENLKWFFCLWSTKTKQRKVFEKVRVTIQKRPSIVAKFAG